MEIASPTASSSQTVSEASPSSHSAPDATSFGNEMTRLLGQDCSLSRSAGCCNPADSGKLAMALQPQCRELQMLPSGLKPLNFGVVIPGVFRCSYPQPEDYPFIQTLTLKTIITLVDRELPEGYTSFIAANGIRHHVFDMKGTKKEAIPARTMKSILRLVLHRQNHPMLIHCNHGKHRTGCVVAIMRKITGWKLADILAEYESFATPKVRDCDVSYITSFQISSVANLFQEATAVGFRVPNFFRVTFFTMLVVVIWMISGSKIAESSPKTRNKSLK